MSRDFMIGRQPIFDQSLNVVGYEVLFRGDRNESAQNMTAQVMVSTLLDLGLEKVGGHKLLYFNIDETFLLNSSELAHALPADKIVLEILEDVPATPAVLAACAKLKELGYTLALDDVLSAEHAEAFIDYISIIKLDWPIIEDRAAVMKQLRKYNVKFLAEKIDSLEDAEEAKSLGIDYYQGYFYCRPDIVAGTKPPESKMSVLRAMQQAMTASSIDDMSAIVKQDVSLSYRLLKYINSAAFGLRREVQSIEQALALLGLKNIRRWLTLLTMTSLAENKPTELIRQALYRAHFLESLARQMGERDVDDDFLLGLFSILDALLDQTMEESLSEVALAEHVHNGLVNDKSEMGVKLGAIFALDRGDWDFIRSFTEDGRRIQYSEILRMQSEAIEWSDQQMMALDSL